MKRFAFAAAIAVGISFAQAQTTAVEPPETFGLNQITAYTTQDLILPANAGEPFRTMVDLNGQLVLLDLAPHSVRSANITFMVNDETGRHELANVPAPATYRGGVDGQPGSTIAGSLVDGQLIATVDLGEGWFWVIEPLTQYDPNANPMTHVVYRSFEVNEKEDMCGVADDALPGIDAAPVAGSSPEVTKILDLAIDNDFEYFTLMQRSTSRMIQDIEQTINRVGIIYTRDIDVIIEISHMELRTSSNDPYTSNDAPTLLNQFTSFWSANMRSINYDLAELFSGRNFNGGTVGIAWLNSVCNKSLSYSAIQIPGLSLSLKVAVSAHELGHNFNAQHCTGSDCRIMCASLGGCAGDISRFGAASISSITRKAARSTCMSSPPPPAMALPFREQFPSTTFTPNRWFDTTGTIITTIGINPPSAPNVAALNRVATLESYDMLVSASLFPTPIFVSYWIQPRGVETGETIVVEYRDSTGTWRTFETIVSNGSNPLGFKPSEFVLNQAAYSDTFRLRFRALGNDTADRWMVDDISVTDRCLADINGDGTLNLFDFLGYQNLFVTSNPRADLTGDGTLDLFDFLGYQSLFVSGCY